MKYLAFLLLSLTAVSLASELPNPATPPKGVSASDWSGIRAAYQAGRHAFQRAADGTLTARNPGQQWNTSFDGKGFTVTPDHGQWTWGLELVSYGERTLLSASLTGRDKSVPAPYVEGGKLTLHRDENLTEWFINDSRGLEQGWTIQERSTGSLPAIAESDGRVPPVSSNLTLTLSVRGGLSPQISTDGFSVSFQTESNTTALTYGGLKAWDADGKNLAVRFQSAGEKALRIAVEDQHARYPITVDPLVQQAYLKASNTEAGDIFGSRVAVSGDTLAVATYLEDSSATGVNGNQASNTAVDSGAVYIFVRNEGTWSQQAYLKASNTGAGDYFGVSLDLSGDTLVVGASREDGGGSGVNPPSNENVTDAGAAYVFVRNGSTWSQQSYLKSSNPGAIDFFGLTVAISGDTAVVGANLEDGSGAGVNPAVNDGMADSGAVYVFTRSGNVWSQQAYIKASNPGAADYFGYPSLSGDTMVVGAPGEDSAATGVNGDQGSNSLADSGAAYVFVRNAGLWTQQAYLKASNTGAGDTFGNSRAISGDTVIIGAHNEDGGGVGIDPISNNASTDAGAAYIFARNVGLWSQQAYLKASNTGAGDRFGLPVAISGDMAVVSSYFEDSSATGIDGNGTDNSATDSGAAYVYFRIGSSWSQLAYLKGSNTGAGDFFGFGAAVSGQTVVVGAIGENGSGTGINPAPNESAVRAGAAYVFVGLGPEILVKGPLNEEILTGGSSNLGGVIVGESAMKTYTIKNTGTAPLLLSGLSVDGGNAGDFIPSTPVTATVAPFTETTFTTTFTPALGGSRSTGLVIQSNDVDEPEFDIQLSGTGLTFTADTDLDGLNDASESRLADLGFDWNSNQSDLVATYYNNANGAGLYNQTQYDAHRVTGRQDVVAAPNTYGLFDQAQYDAYRLTGRQDVIGAPHTYGLFDQTQYDAHRLTGRLDVIAAPNTYGLFDQTQYDAHRLTGRQDVIGAPNTYNLFTPTQLQALKPETPLIARDPVTGKFTLTMDWKKSTDLSAFTDFPAPPGSAVSISPGGDIQFEFNVPDPAAFFRIELE